MQNFYNISKVINTKEEATLEDRLRVRVPAVFQKVGFGPNNIKNVSTYQSF